MNPYEVLGVSVNATDAQVKAAYRELAKKYHPDNYAQSPLADLAQEKMKQINEAYDKICEMRRNKTSTSSYSQSAYKNTSYTNSSYPDVRNLIKQGRLDDAMEILNGVNSRDAEWYYLMGIVFSRKGFTEQAYSYFQTACRMEPDNIEYSSALNSANNRRNYNPYGYNTNSSMGCSMCDICTGIMCVNCCCECLGGQDCC